MTGPIFMKFIKLTNEGIWTTYTKFQTNWLTLGDLQNFKIPEYLAFSRPSFRCSVLIMFMHNFKYSVYSRIEFIFSIYSYYLLYANIGIYQKSCSFI